MPRSRTKLKQYGVRVNGVLIRKSFASAAEARKWQRAQKELQDQIRAGSKKHIDPTLLVTAAADFLRQRKGMSSFDHQETWMGKYILARARSQGKFLHECTRAFWREIFGEKGELVEEHKLSNATHNRVRAMVYTMYESARRDFEPPRAGENPIHDISPLKELKKPPQILTSADDIRKYIEAAYQDPSHPCWGIYVAIKLNTGLRMQNIIPLRWKDLDQKLSHLKIREKFIRTRSFTGFKPGSKSGGEERTVGVNPALMSALEAWLRVTPYRSPEDFIVATEGGSYLKQKQIWDANVRTCKKAGVPYLSEHKLRHSYASHYLAAGGNVHDLKLNLFHASVTTTEIYSHALPSELSRRAEVFQTDAPGPIKRIKSDSE